MAVKNKKTEIIIAMIAFYCETFPAFSKRNGSEKLRSQKLAFPEIIVLLFNKRKNRFPDGGNDVFPK
jgi:hypothetical protein